MRIQEIQTILEARVFCGTEKLKENINSVFASDMMSDILACPGEIDFMLTGLINQQVIRTADMMDIGLIVIVRGKEPRTDVVAMAEERGMTVMVTQKGMFSACGILYCAGLRGGGDGI